MFNQNMRAKAMNEFEKSFYKLLNNSIYGKFIENVRKHIDYRLPSTEAQMRKLVAKPNYKSCDIITENLCGVQLERTKITINKPIICGFCILDLSKAIMLDFYYNVLKKRYNDNIKLLKTDTDSLVVSIETENAYDDIYEMRDYFDLSNFPKGSKYFDSTNKKVICKFKLECSEKFPIVLEEIVGLRPKLDDTLMSDNSEIMTCKGVNRRFAKKTYNHQDYLDCLQNEHIKMAKFGIIRQEHHNLHSVIVSKIGLSPNDDKRYMLNAYDSLPYGHYKISELNEPRLDL